MYEADTGTAFVHVVDLDIKGFFDNINHTKLIRQIWALGIQDKKLLCILKEMLKAPIIMPNGEKVYPKKGTPQGGILSPLLANIVLTNWTGGSLPNGKKCQRKQRSKREITHRAR